MALATRLPSLPRKSPSGGVERLKILYVGGLDSAQKGAVGTHTLGVLNAMFDLGVDLHALFLEDQVPDGYAGPLTLVSASSGVKSKKIVDRFRIAKAAGDMAANYDYLYTRYDPFLSRLIASNKIILEYNDEFMSQIRFAADRGEFSAFGAYVRTSAVYRRLMISIEQHCFSSAHLVVCVTEKLCTIVKERAAQSKTFCMLNGSNAQYTTDLDPRYNDEVLRLGHIGTLTHWDGLRELFESLAQFREFFQDKKIYLTVMGDGSMRGELEVLARSLAINDIVEFRASGSKKEVMKLLHEVDVVPLLKTISDYDLSPIKYYEGLCTGRFILASNISHINEIDSNDGIVVDYPLQIEQISEALSAAHDQLPAIRQSAAERSLSAQRQHSWTARVASLLSHLADLEVAGEPSNVSNKTARITRDG